MKEGTELNNLSWCVTELICVYGKNTECVKSVSSSSYYFIKINQRKGKCVLTLSQIQPFLCLGGGLFIQMLKCYTSLSIMCFLSPNSLHWGHSVSVHRELPDLCFQAMIWLTSLLLINRVCLNFCCNIDTIVSVLVQLWFHVPLLRKNLMEYMHL